MSYMASSLWCYFKRCNVSLLLQCIRLSLEERVSQEKYCFWVRLPGSNRTGNISGLYCTQWSPIFIASHWWAPAGLLLSDTLSELTSEHLQASCSLIHSHNWLTTEWWAPAGLVLSDTLPELSIEHLNASRSMIHSNNWVVSTCRSDQCSFRHKNVSAIK